MSIARLYLITLVLPWSASFGQILQSPNPFSITELPAEVTLELGEIARGEESIMKIAIKNLTNERIALTGSRTDCACALGYVKNQAVPHGSEIEVNLKFRPTDIGDFRRTITLICDEGSNRRISLNVRAKSTPRFSINPPIIRLPSDGLGVTKLTVSAHLDSHFVNPRVSLRSDSIFTADCKQLSDDKLEVSLIPTVNVDQLQEIKRSLSHERLVIVNDGSKEVNFDVPVDFDRDPEIRPSTFYLKPGENQFRLFLFGDFGISFDKLKTTNVRIKFDNELIELEADWRNERLGLLRGTISTEAMVKRSKVGELQILTEGGGEKQTLTVGKVTFERQ